MSNPFADPNPQSLDSVRPTLARPRPVLAHPAHLPLLVPLPPEQNPFADPAVQAGLQSRTTDDYELSGAAPQQPQAAHGGADVQARLEELQRRERELAVRPSLWSPVRLLYLLS